VGLILLDSNARQEDVTYILGTGGAGGAGADPIGDGVSGQVEKELKPGQVQ
jgi:hypothetical protein